MYLLLMLTAGFYGGYTYTVRGGVFCNAQTANFVLFAMALGDGLWKKALYYLIPMSAYFLGAFLSEAANTAQRQRWPIRWETALVGVEMLVVVLLGLLPETAPYQISQVIINFICSMQYNTFRVAEGVPMATTFCTNHVRQVGIHLYHFLSKKDSPFLRRSLKHLGMLAMFVLGGVIGVFCCNAFAGRAIWFAALPMLFLFIDLLRADLTTEKDLLNTLPRGH